MHNVAIIGAGIGAEHAAGYAALPQQYSIATICDLNEMRGLALAETHNANYETDFEAVLADPAIDIVDICLPPHLHFSTLTRVLEAGKIAICEKPLVSSLAEADALAETIRVTDGRVFPVFQYRYGLGTAQLGALIHAGLAGRCFAGTLETHWDRDAEYYAVDWRGTWAGEQGGAVLGHAIHIHDLLCAILGPVEHVYADLATRVNAIEVEDCAAITFCMAEGARVTSSVTLGAASNTSRMRLMFEGFTVTSDTAPYSLASKPWHFEARAPRRQAEIDAVLGQVPGQKDRFAGLFAAIADALGGDDARAVTFDDARRSVELVTAIYASARAGVPVKLPLAADHKLYHGWVPD